MWMYFCEMLGRMVKCFWQAFRTINGCIGMVALLLSVIGSTWAAGLKNLSPTYPFAAVTVLFGYLFVKASYEKDKERQRECDANILAAGGKAIEAEKLRALNEAKAIKLAEVQRQLTAFTDSAPFGHRCSSDAVIGWMAGAIHM